MGMLARLSTVQPLMRAESWGPLDDRWYIPQPWLSSLSAAGVVVTPELAMTVSAFYSGVTMIADDLATLPCQGYRRREDGGKDRVQPFFGAGIDSSNGIRSLTYMLRWQPNPIQTATEFWKAMVAQYLLRGVAYAEILSGPRGFVEALVPRHPDRMRIQRAASGRIVYRFLDPGGQGRDIGPDDMFVVRDLTFDGGSQPVSRITYGAQTVGTILAAERAAGRFFKSGMTASVVASYKGEMEDEDEAALHASITRYATGAENNFGVLLIPDEVTITNLGIEPEKAQMMLAREWGVREVARLLRLPGSKLGLKDSVAYASQVQSAVDYVIGCLRPIAVAFEQAIERDLVIAKDAYFFEFLLDGLLRGDPDARAGYYEKAIRNRWMRPSEVRLRENLNPDPDLDRLSESDFRPGLTRGTEPGAVSRQEALTSRTSLTALFAVRDNAIRCLRRERVAIEKLAKKHANDLEGWHTSLRDFYGDHAQFVSTTMHLHPTVARSYAAQHGTEFEQRGMVLVEGEAGAAWERYEADELAFLALSAVA